MYTHTYVYVYIDTWTFSHSIHIHKKPHVHSDVHTHAILLRTSLRRLNLSFLGWVLPWTPACWGQCSPPVLPEYTSQGSWGWKTQPSALGSDWGCGSPETYIPVLLWVPLAVEGGGRCSTDPAPQGRLGAPEDLSYISVLPAFLHPHPILPLLFFHFTLFVPAWIPPSSPAPSPTTLMAPVFPPASFSTLSSPLFSSFVSCLCLPMPGPFSWPPPPHLP